MIAIVDYGAGNLFSVKNALDYLGLPAKITASAQELEQAQSIILPGVGAFADAMAMLQATGLVPVLKAQAAQKPLLGICLGMQLLFETGYEFGTTKGLGLIPGTVDKIPPQQGQKLPHMGWNSLNITAPTPLTTGIAQGDYVYFVHSYMAITTPQYVSAYTDYNCKVPALVYSGNVYGAQFHPEKSGATGMQILKNFGGLVT